MFVRFWPTPCWQLAANHNHHAPGTAGRHLENDMSRTSDNSLMRHQSIQHAINAHIAGLVDKTIAKREIHLSEEQRQRRRELQAKREEREANREVWE